MQSDRVLTKPFVLTMLSEFALCMSVGMLLAVVPVYAADDLGVGSFGVAVAVAAVSPMVLVCQPLAGRYADRKGRRILVIAGGMLAAITVAAYVLASSLALLVVLRLLTGAGEAMALVGAATIVTDLAPEHRRGEALSVFSLGLWGGLALGPLLGELVLDDTRFDAVWLLAAACCLGAGLIGLALPETAPARAAEPESTARLVHPAAVGPGLVLSFTVLGPLLGELVLDDTRFDAVWLLAAACCLGAGLIGLLLPETAPARAAGPESTARLVHPAAVGPGLVLSFTVLGFAGLGTFGALYARDLGLDGAGSVFLVFSVVVVATRVLARQVPDRLGPKRTSRMALGLIAVGLFIIGLWNVPAGLFAGTVVVAFGHALAFPSLMTLAVNSGPASERSSIVGTFSAFTELGFLIGALSLGAVASAAGYDGVFVVCAFGPLLGVLVLSRLTTPTRVEPLPEAA